MPLDEWKRLFELSDRHGFVIVSDECYSEIYFDESAPPLGALAAANAARPRGLPAPGRDGVALEALERAGPALGIRRGRRGDPQGLRALSHVPRRGDVQHACRLASIAAWKDEAHVLENRRLYREKFAAFYELVNPVLPLTMPEAAFYFWAAVPGDDETFARELFADANVMVLPGSYLSRDAHGVNPGRGFVRMALVSTVEDAVEAGTRIAAFVRARGLARAAASRG